MIDTKSVQMLLAEDFLSSDTLTSQLDLCCGRLNVDADAILQAALVVLVSRYASLDKVTIAICRCGATSPHLLTVIVREEDSILELLSRIYNSRSGTTHTSYHSGTPSSISALKPDLKHVLYSINGPTTTSGSSGLHIRPSTHLDGKLGFKCTFPADAKSTVTIIVRQFFTVLGGITAPLQGGYNGNTVQDLSLKSHLEDMELRGAARPGRDYSDLPLGSLHQKFRAQAQSTPNLVALKGEADAAYTYAQVDMLSDCVARKLKEKLATVSQPQLLDTSGAFESVPVIALYVDRCVELLIVAIAAWKAGLAIVFLEPTNPWKRTKAMLETSCCSFVVTDIKRRHEFPIATITLDELNVDPSGGMLECTASRTLCSTDLMKDFHNLATVRFTSGSTGAPKGVLDGHCTAAPFAVAWGSRFKRNSLLFLSPTFTFCESAIWPYLLTGGCVTVLRSEKLVNLAGCITEYNVTDLFITPSALSMLQPCEVPGLSCIAVAGEFVPKQLVQTWSPHVSLHVTFGASEFGSPPFRPYNEIPIEPPSFYRPPCDMSIYVFKPGTTEIQPFGVPGELCYGATNMTCGYIGQPEQNAKVYEDNPYAQDFGHKKLYRSGDLAVVPSAGIITLLGRLTQQTKIHGVRIDVVEVQNAVLHHPSIQDVRVMGLHTTTRGHVLAACVILHKNAQRRHSGWDMIEVQLRTVCEEHIPQSMIPSVWQSYNDFPTTRTGKVDVGALQQLAVRKCDDANSLAGQKRDAAVDHTLANQPQPKAFRLVESLLLDAIDPVLFGSLREREDDRDNFILGQTFIQCGGTSLGAMKVISTLRRSGIQLSLSDLLERIPLRQIAERVSPSVQVEKSFLEPELSSSAHVLHTTESLTLRATSIDFENVEAVFKCTPFQTLAVHMSRFSPKQYAVYRYLDLSNFDYSADHIRKAMAILVEQKAILRTIIVKSGTNDVPEQDSPVTEINALQVCPLHQIILKKVHFEFSPHFDATNPTDHYQEDVKLGWEYGRVLWRVSFLARPKILMVNLHHALVDHHTSEFLNKDLFALLDGISKSPNDGQRVLWSEVVLKAQRPDMRQLTMPRLQPPKDAGDRKGMTRDRLLSRGVSSQDFWVKYLHGCNPTFMTETSTQSSWQRDMAQPHRSMMLSTSYYCLCADHGVTSGAFWHAIWALTLAQAFADQPPEVTYYCCASNRESLENGFEIEGALCSNTPIRVRLNPSGTIMHLAQDILQDCMLRRAAQSFFHDEFIDGGLFQKQRAYGNTIFNHVVFDATDDDADSSEKFSDLVPGYSYFSQHDMLSVVEWTVLESQNISARETRLVARSRLSATNLDAILTNFKRTFERTLETNGNLTVAELLGSQSRVSMQVVET